MDVFVLPSSPKSLCQDRLSLADSDEDEVPVWSILTVLLAKDITSLQDLVHLLENITVTLRATSGDYGFLCQFLNAHPELRDRFLKTVWPKLALVALDMRTLFPDAYLPALRKDGHSSVELSRQQVSCLVVHQFLCTLQRPHWMQADASLDFSVWFSSEQHHPKVVQAYLSSLFNYFERIAAGFAPSQTWPVRLTLKHNVSMPTRIDVRMCYFMLNIVTEATTDEDYLGLNGGACVIFANKCVGFGRTGTQEEIHVGCTPESAIVSLLTPALEDDEVLVVGGAEAMAFVEGYARSARLGSVLTESAADVRWRRRTMLFMDALELDSFDGDSSVPDLLPGHLDRELKKAFTAFSSCADDPYSMVVTGRWGCGAFGGDEEIKTVLQWCAASLPSVQIRFIGIEGGEGRSFSRRLQAFVDRIQKEAWTVADILGVLRSLDPYDIKSSRATFDSIIERLVSLS